MRRQRSLPVAALFGDDFALPDHTHDALGCAPRSFDSFAAMADEAAVSRLYGGIHYRSAIDTGLQQGACMGARVNALEFRQLFTNQGRADELIVTGSLTMTPFEVMIGELYEP
jgi:hypothetical protein